MVPPTFRLRWTTGLKNTTSLSNDNHGRGLAHSCNTTRRVTALLKPSRWDVNHKRVEKIWRLLELKALARLPKRGRLWLNGGPLCASPAPEIFISHRAGSCPLSICHSRWYNYGSRLLLPLPKVWVPVADPA